MGAFWQTITIKYHLKKHILPSASRKRVDDADAFNDLPVIHAFGQQRFATGGFSRTDNQWIPERKLMKRRNVHRSQDTLCSHLYDFEDRELHQQHSDLLWMNVKLPDCCTVKFLQHLCVENCASGMLDLLQKCEGVVPFVGGVLVHRVDQHIGFKEYLAHFLAFRCSSSRWMRFPPLRPLVDSRLVMREPIWVSAGFVCSSSNLRIKALRLVPCVWA